MEDNKIVRSKERHRRKGCKSPINIRLKIRELQERMSKNHRTSQKIMGGFRRTSTPQKNAGGGEVKQIAGQQPERGRNGMRQELKKSEKVNARLVFQPPAQSKPIQPRPALKILSPPSHPHYSPTTGILRIKSQQCRRRITPDNSQDDLQKLKQQNQKYRQVYNKSVQKLQALEHQLEQMRHNYASEKNNWKKTCNLLEFKAEVKKIPLAHIYSYENRNNLAIGADKIITEQENENSSLRDPQGLQRSSLLGFSLLTQHSHQP